MSWKSGGIVMDLYSDQKKKIEYYRQRIIQNFTKKGIYPDDTMISTRLSDIDTKLGVFQYINVGRGETFDTAKFNEDMLRIWQDLKILYELAYEITVKDYEELQLWCEVHLTELQNMANTYRYKTNFELSSTYLGDTLLYQSTGFNLVNSNGTITINLGSVNVEAQSKLYCIFEADKVLPQNVIFNFKDQDNNINRCSPYSYNRDYFTVPGTLSKNVYKVTLKGDNVRTSFICTPESLAGKVSDAHKYKLFGGYGYISFNYYTTAFAEKLYGVPVEMPEGGIAVFYILDGTYANFEFSVTPKHKNFDGVQISDMPHCQKVVIEHDGALSFDFVTDGQIYATHHDGRIIDNELIYPAADQINDILIEEYYVGNKVNYDISVNISPIYDGNVPSIKAIAVKQLSSLEAIS